MKWISVKDRLPDVSDEFLDWSQHIVCLKNKAVIIMEYHTLNGTHRWFYQGVGEENKFNPVTHWMPLPEPPK